MRYTIKYTDKKTGKLIVRIFANAPTARKLVDRLTEKGYTASEINVQSEVK